MIFAIYYVLFPVFVDGKSVAQQRKDFSTGTKVLVGEYSVVDLRSDNLKIIQTMTRKYLRATRAITATALSVFALNAYAAAPKCFSQSIEGHTTEICRTSAPFQHDYYELKVDRALIFVLPDDYVEDVTLVHTIPKDAAIEFPLSMQGTPTVTISGGCTPVSADMEGKGGVVGVETGRRCSFKWGKKDILKDLVINY